MAVQYKRTQRSKKGENIFITGGAGFIGANLVKYLLDKGGFVITVYDNLSVGSKKNLERAINDSQRKGSVRFIKGDILNRSSVQSALHGHTAVIHLAAHTRVVESLRNPRKNFTVNTEGTFNVLEAARKNNVKKFIFASSNAAVGEQSPPINENMIPHPISPYGASKLVGEALCTSYFHSYGVPTISLRFANAYGPYSHHKSSVIATFVKRLKHKRAVEIFGDGTQTRDFIHAVDICNAIFLSLRLSPAKKNVWGEVFQVATGTETSIVGLVRMFQNSAARHDGQKVKIVFRQQRKGEIEQNYADIRKVKRILGFKPTIALRSGIERMVNARG